MKYVHLGLIRIYWRQCLPATVISTLALALMSLTWGEVLTWDHPWIALAIVMHCVAVGFLLGQFDRPAFAFTYTRGYSRDTIWVHLMLASALSALMAWGIASLILWTHLRSVFQDQLVQSPLFPVMTPSEQGVPLVWLGLYLLLMPASHYAWIRIVQPTRSGQGGNYVVMGLLVSLLVAFYWAQWPGRWFGWLVGIACLVACVAMLLGGFLLHRSAEVRS